MKNKRRGNLNGAVLIMVLTVMFVLIIMLMATLTVVSTASQRIYAKYEENQAYYTARSALDVFSEKMLNDAKLEVTPGGNTQGFELQEKLYTIIVHDGATDDKPQGDDADGDGIGDTAATGKNDDIYGVPDKDYVEYKVDLPQLAGNVSGKLYSNFSDDDGVKIRVEVIDRSYDPTGNRKKDYMRIKVTSTATVQGVESTAAAIFGSKKPPANTATRAVTVTGDGSFTTNNSTVLGGVAVDPVAATSSNTPTIWGNTYFGSNYQLSSNGPQIVLTEDQWVYFGGDVVSNNGLRVKSAISDNTKRPNVFIDGNFDASTNQITTGEDGNEINIIVSNLGDETKGNFKISNNGYTHWGDLYVMGDAKMASNGSTINGDLYVAGDLDSRGGNNRVNVTGKIVVGGNILTDTNGDGSPKNYPNAGGSIITSASASDFPEVKKSDDEKNITVDWGSRVQEISLKDTLYKQFYRYGVTDGNEGTVTASEYAFLSVDELEALMDKDANFQYPDNFKVIHEYIDENADSTETLSLGNPITSPGKYALSPSGDLSGATTLIDCGGEVEIFLKEGNYNNAKIVVDENSGTTVKVYGEPGTYNFNNFKITTLEVEGSGDLCVGEYGSDPLDPVGSLMKMPTSFYFEGNSEITFSNSAIMVGHFYAPRADIYAGGGGVGSVASRLKYNNQSYTNGGDFVFLGSLLCQSYDLGSSQKGCVAFVKGTSDAPPPTGQPALTFEAVEYSRR